MDGNNLIISILVKHALRKKLNREEKTLLADWRAQSDGHRLLAEKFRDSRWVAKQRRQLHSAPSAEMWADISSYIGDDDKSPPAPALPESRFRIGFRRFVAAAVILLLLSVGGWWLAQWQKTRPAVAVVTRKKEKSTVPALPPADFRAVLRQRDGSLLLLDTMEKGARVGIGGGYSLQKLDSLNYAYDKLGGTLLRDDSLPQQLTTGPHGNIVMHWPDKSYIGLNRSSTLFYPADLVHGSRDIGLAGEACFYVAASPARPCTIRMGHETSVQVLGTTFDARNYDNEPDHWITVISGAVKVNRGDRSVVAKHQQEVRVDGKDLELRRVADPATALAWINPGKVRDLVDIEDADLPSLLHTVAALYRVQISNPARIKGISITGTLSSRQTLQATLKSLESVQLHTVRLQLHGDTVLVVPVPKK